MNDEYSHVTEALKNLPLNALLTVQLHSGDIILGGLFHIRGVVKELPIAFNTPEGNIFNRSMIADVKFGDIVDIGSVPLADEVYTRLAPMRYPNPLATIIYEHNMAVADANDISVGGYIEKSFAPTAVPEGGIALDKWFMLYADYKEIVFDQRQPITASISLPFVSLGRNFNTEHALTVQQKLREIKAHQGNISIQIPDGTVLMGFNGVFQHRLEDDDDIEGDTCYVWEVVLVRGNDIVTRLIAMKKTPLKYPLGFVHRLAAEFTFVVEPMPLPLTDSRGVVHSTLYLARAIAHVPHINALSQ